jgi:putative transposase
LNFKLGIALYLMGKFWFFGMVAKRPASGNARTVSTVVSFFATLECELIDRRSWKTKADARLAIFTWVESWYNPLRRHSGLGQRFPNAFERSLNSQKTDADIIEVLDISREPQTVR